MYLLPAIARLSSDRKALLIAESHGLNIYDVAWGSLVLKNSTRVTEPVLDIKPMSKVADFVSMMSTL
jgi:hypothetical protein